MDPKLFISTYFAGGIFLLTVIITFSAVSNGLPEFENLYTKIGLGGAAGLIALAPVLGFLIGTLHIVLRRFGCFLLGPRRDRSGRPLNCWNFHDDAIRIELKEYILNSIGRNVDTNAFEKMSPDTFLSFFTFKDFPKELSDWRRRLNGGQLAGINNSLAVWLGFSLSFLVIYIKGGCIAVNIEGFYIVGFFALVFMSLFLIQAIRCYYEERHLYELVFYSICGLGIKSEKQKNAWGHWKVKAIEIKKGIRAILNND
ncbi:MAG TPA: hypothetical protein VMX79_12420 [bacterium]|nr:hypothetical protein [bacterium]